MTERFYNGDYSRFGRITEWVFDLDNTLYRADTNLFGQVDQRMGGFIAEFLGVPFEQARGIQKDYYYRYGTTLSGLMHEHNLAPERFLDYVHDIDLTLIDAAPALQAAILSLPGRKFVFTNGSRRHAERVTERLGLTHLFDGFFDIQASGYVPKPKPDAFNAFCKHFAVNDCAAMFEDLPHNLEAPHALGWSTVLVRSSFHDHPSQRAIDAWDRLPAHIHHFTDDLGAFLVTVATALVDRRESESAEKPATATIPVSSS